MAKFELKNDFGPIGGPPADVSPTLYEPRTPIRTERLVFFDDHAPGLLTEHAKYRDLYK